jgi:IS30 family transposase
MQQVFARTLDGKNYIFATYALWQRGLNENINGFTN